MTLLRSLDFIDKAAGFAAMCTVLLPVSVRAVAVCDTAALVGRSALFSMSASLSSDSPSGSAQIRFTYENPKLQPAKYVLVIEENGNGRYSSQPGDAPLDHDQLPARPQDRAIEISPATRDAIFVAARHNKYFDFPCESGGDHIAFQGKKTLEYSGPDGHGSCSYNWSKDKQIDELTEKLESIAATLDEGSKLEVEYEHSRLSLDSELELLVELVHDGRASELNNIAPILTKIAQDDAVLKRAQRRASDLLAIANGAKAQ